MNTIKTLVLIPFVVVSLLGVGCAASTTIYGKVIPGNVGFVGAVDASDERLKSDGVPGVEVKVAKNPDEGGVRIGQGTSDAKGNFRVVIHDQTALIRPAEFAASGPGVLPASGVMSIPANDRRVLIILKPSGAAGGK